MRSVSGDPPATLPADQLVLVAAEVTDLLSRVDRALECYGVPPGHPVLDGLRRFRALPGTLADPIVALDPAPLWQRAQRLAGLRIGIAEHGATLRRAADQVAWTGSGADGFRRQLAPVVGQLAGPGLSMMDTVLVTALHGARMACWWSALRTALVEFFVRHATTAEAATVRAAAFDVGDPADLPRSAGVALAAADLAAGCYAVLRPVLADGEELSRWAGDTRTPVARPPGAPWPDARSPGASTLRGVPLLDALPIAAPEPPAGSGSGRFQVRRD